MPDSSEVIKNIVHYQKSLDRYSQKRDDSKILHCIGKLYSMPVTVAHLEKTGIGRTVNSLRKLGGNVEDAAKTLVRKWKQMVSGNNEDDEVESKVQDSRRGNESNSSHRHSDKHRNSDHNDKPNKDDRYNHSKRDKYEDNGHRSSSEAKYKAAVSSNSEDDENGSPYQSGVEEEEDDGESGVASESERSSSSEEDNNHSERSYDKHRELPCENSSKFNRRDSDRHNTSRERSESKERLKRNEAQIENYHKKDKHSSSSENANKHSSKKRKYDSSDSSEEESKKKIPKKSQDTHKLSSNRSRESTSDSHRSSHKNKETSSSHSHSSKKDSRSDADRKDSKSSLRNEKKGKESSKDEQPKPKRESSDKKSREKDKSKDKSSSKSSSSSSSNGTHKKMVDICSESGTSFAEALGMLEPSTSRISTTSTTNSVSSKKPRCSEMANHKLERPPKDKSSSAKPPKSVKIDIVIPPPPPKVDIDINISSLLPSITPNYRPVANPFLDTSNLRSKVMNDDEALNLVMCQKNLRTKVYSGNKSYFGTVPTLFELCIRVLQDNIDALEYTGGVPYSILKPILDKATPDQLFMLEHHNPYLIEDSDEIWMYHCQKEFRSKRREELESWREMYMRCLDEREAKLKALTENIKLAQDKSIPVRQTKLAYVDSVVKPPRDVIRKQVKSGFVDKKPAVTPSARLSMIAASGAAGQVSVPNPVRASSSSGHSSAAIKPKKAPLMQKTLQFLKGNRFRR